MENSYFIIVKYAQNSQESYVYDISRSNTYTSDDYTQALRFSRQDAATVMTEELNLKAEKTTTYTVAEIKTTVNYL